MRNRQKNGPYHRFIIGQKVKIYGRGLQIITVTIEDKYKFPTGMMYFGKTAKSKHLGHGFYAWDVIEKVV